MSDDRTPLNKFYDDLAAATAPNLRGAQAIHSIGVEDMLRALTDFFDAKVDVDQSLLNPPKPRLDEEGQNDA